MILRDAREEFLSYIADIRNFSPNTVLSYREDLGKLCAFLGEDKVLAQINYDDFSLLIASLSEQKYAITSINRIIVAIRSFFRYCHKFGLITKNPSLRLKTLRSPKNMPKFLFQTEVDKLCEIPSEKPILWEERDKALFELFYSTGCRVSEIAALKLSDLSADRTSAMVLGKGNKQRRVFIAEDARVALNTYLASLEARKFTADNGLFLNSNGGPLTVQGIRYILNRYSGIEGTNRPISPHALRHTFATACLSNGADIRVVQELLGHENISTTQRYTHITTAQLINTYNQAHPHGRG